jgi:hypothetical protein
MGQTVYLIYEKPAGTPPSAGHQTRVYFDKDLAEKHVEENDNPTRERWMIPKESTDG